MRTVTLALTVCLAAACGDKQPPPDTTPTAPAGPRSDAAILWDREARALTAYGLPTGSVSERLQELAAALGVRDLTIARPGRPETSDANLMAMFEPILALDRARLVIEHKDVSLQGSARRARRKAAAEEAARAVVPGGKVVVDIAIDGETLRADEGVLELVGFDRPVEELAPRPILKGVDALGEAVDAHGDPLVDERGRIAEGLYQLSDGTNVGIARGRRTIVKAGAPAIVVGQRRFTLDEDIPLVALDAPDALSFVARPKGPDDMPTFGPRYERAGVTVARDDLPHARRVVEMIVLHADLVDEAKQAFEVFVARSLSSHFLIDFDGRVFQALDPIDCAYHAGELNPRGIGVDLNNRMRNLVREPGAPAYDTKHARFAEMEQHPRGAPTKARINGVEVEAWGYTEAQWRSLLALTRRLADIFPAIAQGSPKGPDGAVTLDAIPQERWRGVLGHLHGEANRWDPGPFDWARIDAALASRAITPRAQAPVALAPIDPGAAPGGPATRARITSRWSRLDGALHVARAEHAGAVVRGARERAASLGATTFSFVEPALPDVPEPALAALFEGLLALKEGSLEIDGNKATLVGRTHLPADVERVKAAVARAEGITTDVKVEVDAASLLAGEARLETRGAPLPMVKRLSDGQAVTPDALGRVPGGTYTLADDTVVIARAGRATPIALDGAPIVVGGRRFRLDRADVRVVPPGDAAGPRVEAGAPRITSDDLEALRASVDTVVLTADRAADAPAGIVALAQDGTVPHFAIDFDGTIFQTLDPANLGRLRGEPEPRAIIVSLNNLLPNLEDTPDAPAYPPDHPRAAEMAKHPRAVTPRREINAARVSSHGYTEAQIVALGALLRRLDEIFPALAAGVPRDPRGEVRTIFLDRRPTGVVPHWQLDPVRWAPGPIDWARLDVELGGGPLEESPGPEGARRIAERLRAPDVDGIVLLARLQPTPADCEAVFTGQPLAACKTGKALRHGWSEARRLVAGGLVASGDRDPARSDATIVVGSVTQEGLESGELGGFTSGVDELAGHLVEGVVLHRVAFGPGEDAPAIEGLVHANGRWLLFPGPGTLAPAGP
ncbi:MAG: N-acetylmuramoyl-L-alanine amidase [Deltaproteobacteria bacterium]|nr:N-acetylmuramoyl-L-alanine amidase [Deltaproteobacteria bacterium]